MISVNSSMHYMRSLLKISSYCKQFLINDWFKLKTILQTSDGIMLSRSMAHVSNKRITRLPSDNEIDQTELNQNGNEKYIDVRLKNRNPRNLEQMLMEPKPMGYEMYKQSPHYWNKIIMENKSKYLVGKIIHHSGRTLVKASTNEPSIAIFLRTGQSDIKAAMILGQVLAIRALESGIHSVFCDYKEYKQSGTKVSSFIDALKRNGLNLNEQPVIFARAQRDH